MILFSLPKSPKISIPVLVYVFFIKSTFACDLNFQLPLDTNEVSVNAENIHDQQIDNLPPFAENDTTNNTSDPEITINQTNVSNQVSLPELFPPEESQPLEDSTQFKMNYEFFGWYPQWFPDYHSELRYDILSTVSYFSLEFNRSNGTTKTSYDWKSTPLIDSTLNHKVKLLLTVTSFGEDSNHVFLNNLESMNTLSQGILDELSAVECQGVCLDFENISESDAEAFVYFVQILENRFRASKKEYQIYVSLPAGHGSESFLMDELKDYVHRFVIMGYGYANSKGHHPSAISPVASEHGGLSLTSTLDYYTSKSSEINKKLILALPSYGMFWEKGQGNSEYNFIGYRTLNYIQRFISKSKLDSISKGVYANYDLDDMHTKSREIWFNDARSFKHQLELVKSYELAGAGIWALGYEKNCPELWQVIGESLGNKAEEEELLAAESPSTYLDDFRNYVDTIFNKAEKRTALIMWILMLIVGFGLLGLIRAMFDNQVREFFISESFYRNSFAAVMLVSIILLFLRLDMEEGYDKWHDSKQLALQDERVIDAQEGYLEMLAGYSLNSSDQVQQVLDSIVKLGGKVVLNDQLIYNIEILPAAQNDSSTHLTSDLVIAARDNYLDTYSQVLKNNSADGPTDVQTGVSGLILLLIIGFALGILAYTLANRRLKTRKNRLP